MPLDLLDLGGRIGAPAGYKTLDKTPPADIVIDLETVKSLGYDLWDGIRAHDVLEHIHNLCPLMDVLWSGMKAGGVLDIEVPLFPHGCAVHDPTHVRYFTMDTFSYFRPFLSYFGYVKHQWDYAEPPYEKDGRGFVKLTPVGK